VTHTRKFAPGRGFAIHDRPDGHDRINVASHSRINAMRHLDALMARNQMLKNFRALRQRMHTWMQSWTGGADKEHWGATVNSLFRCLNLTDETCKLC